MFEPVALSAKLFFAGAAGFAASLLGDLGNDNEELNEANNNRLGMPAKWLLWWCVLPLERLYFNLHYSYSAATLF